MRADESAEREQRLAALLLVPRRQLLARVARVLHRVARRAVARAVDGERIRKAVRVVRGVVRRQGLERKCGVVRGRVDVAGRGHGGTTGRIGDGQRQRGRDGARRVEEGQGRGRQVGVSTAAERECARTGECPPGRRARVCD